LDWCIFKFWEEELKAVEKLGYKFKFIRGYEFSKKDLFSEFINFFYLLKKNSNGAERWIAKQTLNTLYGYFGRKQELIETVNIFNKDIYSYLLYRLIKHIIIINDDISVLLLECNSNSLFIDKLNQILDHNFINKYSIVKSNVAIAAAVTAYARIEMIPYSLMEGTVYTDTDSIFTTDLLPDHLIGKDIGLMKDELNGITIKEGLFLGIKKYGYWYLDNNNNKIENSTIAGIDRNTISFDKIQDLFCGITITKFIPIRFFKSLNNLTISIKSTHITIDNKCNKKLINNKYLPIHLNKKHVYYDFISAKIIKFFNKFLKIIKIFII
jgi:DNA polymerase type B, organellar and viral